MKKHGGVDNRSTQSYLQGDWSPTRSGHFSPTGERAPVIRWQRAPTAGLNISENGKNCFAIPVIKQQLRGPAALGQVTASYGPYSAH
jgi:hypothetical protein